MMHSGVECVPEHETLDRAAQLMREHNVGSLPICGNDNRLKGIITDRDIVLKCVAIGQDPSRMTAAQLANGAPVWVPAEADEDDVLSLMQEHSIRRLPVLDDHELVGMISEADVATNLPADKVARFTNAIYSAPASI
jgi:CBS domain-containing protein